MITLLVLLAVYILSAICGYKYIQITHSKGGRWQTLKPTSIDTFFVFCPILNIAMIFLLLFSRKYDIEKNYSKLFKIKK